MNIDNLVRYSNIILNIPVKKNDSVKLFAALELICRMYLCDESIVTFEYDLDKNLRTIIENQKDISKINDALKSIYTLYNHWIPNEYKKFDDIILEYLMISNFSNINEYEMAISELQIDMVMLLDYDNL